MKDGGRREVRGGRGPLAAARAAGCGRSAARCWGTGGHLGVEIRPNALQAEPGGAAANSCRGNHQAPVGRKQERPNEQQQQQRQGNVEESV